MKKLSFALLAIFCLMAVSPVTQARHHKGKGHHIERMQHNLGLTQEQTKQIKNIHHKYKSKIKSQRKAIKAAKASLSKSFVNNASDATLKSKFSEYNALKSQLEQMRFDQKLEMNQVLTPEQRKKHKVYAKRHKKHHKNKKSCDWKRGKKGKKGKKSCHCKK